MLHLEHSTMARHLDALYLNRKMIMIITTVVEQLSDMFSIITIYYNILEVERIIDPELRSG